MQDHSFLIGRAKDVVSPILSTMSQYSAYMVQVAHQLIGLASRRPAGSTIVMQRQQQLMLLQQDIMRYMHTAGAQTFLEHKLSGILWQRLPAHTTHRACQPSALLQPGRCNRSSASLSQSWRLMQICAQAGSDGRPRCSNTTPLPCTGGVRLCNGRLTAARVQATAPGQVAASTGGHCPRALCASWR